MDRRAFLAYSVVGAMGAAAATYSVSRFNLINLPALTEFLQTKDPPGSMAEEAVIPHLLRGAGFGGDSSELALYQRMGFDTAVNHLVNYEGLDNLRVPPRPSIIMSNQRSEDGDLQA